MKYQYTILSLCVFFLCITSTQAKLYQGELRLEGKTVATLEKTVTNNSGNVEVSVKTFDLSGILTSERHITIVQKQLMVLKVINHEFQQSVEARYQNGEFHLQANGEPLEDTIEHESGITFFDAIDSVIQENWEILVQGKELELKMLSPMQASTLTMEMTHTGSQVFQGKQRVVFTIKPSGFLMSFMSAIMDIEAKIFMDPNTKEWVAMKGPVFGIPGVDPQKQSRPTMGQLIWNVHDTQ